MLSNIKHKILEVNRATGLEVVLIDEGQELFGSQVTAEKGKIINKRSFRFNGPLTTLRDHADKEIPVHLVINGKGVLIKNISGKNSLPTVQNLLPNANPRDYYFQQYHIPSGNFAAIARRAVVDKICNTVIEAGFLVIKVSLGNGALQTVASFIPEITESVEEFSLGDQYVKANHLLSFAAGMNLLSENLLNGSDEMINEEIEGQRKEFRYSRYFAFAAWSVLIFFVGSLLISFMFYNKYFNRNSTLASTQMANAVTSKDYRNLEKSIRMKEKFLHESQWNEHSRVSYYVDRIAALVPGEIRLNGLQVYPARTAQFSEAGINTFKKDTILVNGVCNDPGELDQFVKGLEIISAFREVNIRSYTMRGQDSEGLFTMEIVVR